MQCVVEGCRRKVSPQHNDLGLCQICRYETKSFNQIINEEISDEGYNIKLARYISLNISAEYHEMLIERILQHSVSEGVRNYYLNEMLQTMQSNSLTVLLLEKLDSNLNSPQIFDAICSSLSYRLLSNENMNQIESITLKTVGIDDEQDYLRSICRIYNRFPNQRNVSLLIDSVKNLRLTHGPSEIISTILRHIRWDSIREFLDIDILYANDERRPSTVRKVFIRKIEHYLPILFHRFPNKDWSIFWDLNGIDINSIRTLTSNKLADIIAKYGTDQTLLSLDKFVLSDKTFEYCYERAKRMVIFRKENPIPRGMKVVEKNYNSLKFLIKDSYGYSESRFYGFYMGLSRGSQPTTIRRDILNEMITHPLHYENGVIINKGYPHIGLQRQWHKIFYLLGNGNYSDWRKRISSAIEYMYAKPWHPWGYYAYDILNKDRLCLLRTYGPSVGILPIPRETNLPGLISCDAVDIFGQEVNCPLCKSSRILPHSEGVQCWDCKELIVQYDIIGKPCDEFAFTRFNQIDFEKSIFGKVVSQGDSFSFEQSGDNELISVKELEKMDRNLVKTGIVIPIFIKNHLAAMYADTEEMAGVGGDSIKRHFLD
jgi:hypothetical protein